MHTLHVPVNMPSVSLGISTRSAFHAGMTGRAETADPWAMYTRYYVVLAVLKAGRMINGSIVQKKMGMRGLGHAKRAHLQY